MNIRQRIYGAAGEAKSPLVTVKKPKGAKAGKKAAKGGMMEVAMGKLAEEHSQNPDVKSFGQRMQTDHGKANEELKSIASKKGVQLPTKEHTGKWTSDKAYYLVYPEESSKLEALKIFRAWLLLQAGSPAA